MSLDDHDRTHEQSSPHHTRIEPLLDERAAAKYLGVSPRTLWGLANQGEVQYVRIGKASKRYDPHDLRAYCDKHRSRPPATGGTPQLSEGKTDTTTIHGGTANG